ncbi:MAG TPA: DNA polymerase/3'-5' exonuclease PolX [Phycisphaerae bacterium]|nr:DNA polymerase/3'-5' exonuclease PolX [Phycisphaerae bacterium]
MTNQEIADLFEGIADLMEILGENPFRINSYRKAARVIGEHTEAMADVAAAGTLEDIPGIGESTAKKVRQALETGKVEMHEELKAKVPPGLPRLLEIGGLGPKTVAKLWKQGGIESVEQLKDAIANEPDRLKAVPGLGAKKIRQISESIAFLEAARGRIRLDEASEIAERLAEVVRGRKGVRRVIAAGSLRRGRETLGDIDLLCEAPKSAGEKITAAFAEAPGVRRVVAQGATKCSILTEGDVEVDLRVVPSEGFGAAMQYFTGSKDHNVRLRELAVRKGWKLNEYGLFDGEKPLAGADEEGIYKALGLAFVPPELREDRGEVEAAARNELPDLLQPDDIRGDLHMHTTASDGLNSIDEMIDACRQRGYEYMAICDHSKSQIQAHGLDEKRLAGHAEAIRKAAAKHEDILVLVGVEVDIFKDGHLDFDADVLAELDFVTASAHSALALGRKEATTRLIKAIEQPHVHCIGHASGRLIGQRAGMEIDIDEIAAAAAAHDVALEINAHPWRLDLRDTHVRAAVAAGAKLLINTDSHKTADLDLMRFGVATARRGWATAADVLNTLPPAKLKAWLGGKA